MLTYQDALFADGVQPGERDCDERWSLIEPVLPRRGVLLDVGSNLGYFSISAALSRPELAVLSLESSRQIARQQRDILASQALDRVCLLETSLDAATTRAWRETCDWLDVVLLLSVLHWVDDPEAVVADLSAMSGMMIVEVPDAADAGACGQSHLRAWEGDPLEWFRRVTGRQCRLLGRASRHTSDVPSHLILIDGPVQRTVTRPYWNCVSQHPRGRSYSFDFDGADLEFRVRGARVPYEPGLNLVNLLHLGRLHSPQPSRMLTLGRQALAETPGHADPLPHNLIWTARGFVLVDGEDVWSGASRREARGMLESAIRTWSRRPHGTAGRHYRAKRLASPRHVRDAAAGLARRALPPAAVAAIRSWRHRRAGLRLADPKPFDASTNGS